MPETNTSTYDVVVRVTVNESVAQGDEIDLVRDILWEAIHSIDLNGVRATLP